MMKKWAWFPGMLLVLGVLVGKTHAMNQEEGGGETPSQQCRSTYQSWKNYWDENLQAIKRKANSRVSGSGDQLHIEIDIFDEKLKIHLPPFPRADGTARTEEDYFPPREEGGHSKALVCTRSDNLADVFLDPQNGWWQEGFSSNYMLTQDGILIELVIGGVKSSDPERKPQMAGKSNGWITGIMIETAHPGDPLSDAQQTTLEQLGTQLPDVWMDIHTLKTAKKPIFDEQGEIIDFDYGKGWESGRVNLNLTNEARKNIWALLQKNPR